MARRVVITAIGMVTPLGNDAESTWSALLAGKCGLGPIASFDASPLPIKNAGEVKGYRARDYVESPKSLKVMTPMVQYGVGAVKMASDAAKLLPDVDPERFGIATGAGQPTGDPEMLVPAIEASTRADGSFDIVKFGKQIEIINPLWLLRGLSNNVLGFSSAQLNAQGWNTNICNSGASGLMAIGDAAKAIAEDRADVVIAGGYDALVSPESIVRHARLGLLSATGASRPFDARRDGFVPADGAAFLVLEAVEHAHRRGARAIAEVLGYGVANDAYRLLDPDPAGEGMARAMKAALDDAEVGVDRVEAVFAHATGNPRYDRMETAAIRSALGPHTPNVIVTALKGAVGHSVAASGSIAAAAAAFAARDFKVPPVVGLEQRDPECDLDFATETRDIASGAIVVNASGLGGQNASLVLSDVSEWSIG